MGTTLILGAWMIGGMGGDPTSLGAAGPRMPSGAGAWRAPRTQPWCGRERHLRAEGPTGHRKPRLPQGTPTGS